MDERGNAAQPRADADFEVWALLPRKGSSLKHGYMCGVRRGPSADGSQGDTPNAPPPALRIAFPWEVLSIPEAPD